MSYLLGHTAAFALLAAVFWLPGYAIESRWLRCDRGLRLLARFCLGLGFWIAALFALALVGALHLPALATVAGGLALAALWTSRIRWQESATVSSQPQSSSTERRPRCTEGKALPKPSSDPKASVEHRAQMHSAGSGRDRATSPAADSRQRSGDRGGRRWRWRRRDRNRLLVGAALVAVLVPFFLLALTPAVSWDAGVYHLTLPRLYLAEGGFREVPFNVYSNWPLATELLFAAAMLAFDYVVAKLVHFGFGLLTLYAVYAGCRRFHVPERLGETSGWLAMALFLANGVVLYEIRVAYVDLAHAFFFTAAFLFLMRAMRPDRGEPDPGADRALLLAGLCAGVVAGVKLSGVAGAGILAVVYLARLVAATRAGELRASLERFGLRFALPVAACWVPWLVKSAWYTGNPFYPLLFGGPYWSPALAEKLGAWQRSIGMGREPVDYLLLPLRVILEGGPGYGRFDGELGVFWIAVVPVALWAARHHWLVRRSLAAAGLYLVFWASSSQQMRLLIPMLPLLAIAGGVGAVEVLERLPWRAARPLGRRILVLGSLALLVWSAGVFPEGRTSGDRPVKPTRTRYFAVAGKALNRFLSGEGDLRRSAVHPAYGFIGTLPADARLLFLNTNQGFFCDREYLADSFFEASQIADWLAPAQSVAELRTLLAEQGVTHLLIESRDRGIAYPAALLALLDDPRQAELVYRSPDERFSVVELR